MSPCLTTWYMSRVGLGCRKLSNETRNIDISKREARQYCHQNPTGRLPTNTVELPASPKISGEFQPCELRPKPPGKRSRRHDKQHQTRASTSTRTSTAKNEISLETIAQQQNVWDGTANYDVHLPKEGAGTKGLRPTWYPNLKRTRPASSSRILVKP